MPHEKFDVPATPEVNLTVTEKFAVNVSEVDAFIEIGDVTDIRFKGELLEKKDDILIFRKIGAAEQEGSIRELTVEEMRSKLPKARR